MRTTTTLSGLALFSALFLLPGLPGAAQPPRVEYLTIADGLSQGMIYDIEQTDDGFLWFATKDGLNRYDGYRFEVFTNDPFNPFSIAGNDIHQLFEDSRGNLWIFVFDKGVDLLEKRSGRFLHLKGNPGDGLSLPTAVAETKDGTIWLATSQGLYRLQWRTQPPPEVSNGKSGSAIESYMTVERVKWQKPSSSNVIDIFVESDGSVLLYILGAGLYRYTPTNGQMTLLAPVESYVGAFSFQSGTNGRVWALSNGRVFLIENGSQPRQMQVKHSLQPHFISRIYPDGRGNLIIAVSSLYQGTYFFKAEEEALVRDGGVEYPELVFSLEMYSPWSDVDCSGNLWVGTSGYGLRKINLVRLPFQHFLPGNSMHKILFGDKVYLSNKEGRCLELDEASNTVKSVSGEFPSDLLVQNICKAKSGVIYFIAYRENSWVFGIKKNTDFESLSLKPLGEHSQLMEDSRGNIWTGSAGFLACYQPSANRISYLDFFEKLGANAVIHALHEDMEKNLWVGTTNGVIRFSSDDLRFTNGADGQSSIVNHNLEIFQTNPSNPRSLRHNFVTAFCADPLEPQRYLWMSTKGGGLNLLDKTTGEFTHFTNQNSGLPNDVVYGILPENTPSKGAGGGNIWGSTNRGIFRLSLTTDPSSKERGAVTSPYSFGERSGVRLTFRNFREFDGLQSDEFNTGSFGRGENGRLYFGGVNGLTVFDPAAIIDRQTDAAVLLTSLKINNLTVAPNLPPARGGKGDDSPLDRPIFRTEEIRLQHTQATVTLDFSLMDFVNPAENRYRYRLHGVDPDWVDANTNHSATYTNLPSGSYTFEVQGAISGGKWSNSTSLKIKVLPPWWATWWAYLLYALALGGTFFAFYKIRLRQKLEHQEALRLRELDEFKSRFFTNITHEFRTPLTVILGISEQVESQVSHEIKGKIGLIRRNGQNLLRLINQILDLAKLKSNSLKMNYVQGDVLPYLRYIAESLHSFANAQNVMVRLESSEAEIVMDYDPERLLQIVHNLLSNAIKFTPSGGRVTLRAEVSGEKRDVREPSLLTSHLSLLVSDTGVGIPADDLPKIFDRFFQASNQSAVSSWRTNSTAGGTGIGLSLTKELVKAMGGEISVESRTSPSGDKGAGTTFTVRLPITNTSLPPTPSKGEVNVTPPVTFAVTSPPPLEGVGGRLNSEGVGERLILLIEDNPDVVEYLAACLASSSSFGGGQGNAYQLDFAYNGRAGIEKALETIPDLIISDVMMPEMDGFEVCDFLKNDERTSHIPIVLLTAKADVESRIAGLKRGADAYLAKPFHQEELAVTLANLLELRRRLQAKYSNPGMEKLEVEPSMPEPPSPDTLEDAFLKKLRLCIEENMSDTTFDGGRLAKAMHLSEVQLYRKIKALTDKSTAIYIRSVRLAKGRELLQTTQMNVSEIAYEVGFDDPNYFSRTFSQEFGMAPSEVRK